MMWVKMAVAAGCVVVVAAAVLIWEGTTLERILSIGKIPIIDFATLQRADTPNQYLACPNDLCRAYIDDLPPVYAASVAEVRSAWEAMLQAEPRVVELRRDPQGTQIDYVQRSRLLRFPDLITIRFIPLDDKRTTLAIYSRSIYGEGDMGVNKARIRGWVAKLNNVLKLS
ncbi:MAG TPA: DUF1499 domain-containing protein [Alphaproteobacteria bacterium]|nr:DUF1499 domain-containing protein [Alphaproteobacteria bacterium]